jgi:type III secretory pathway component EscR
MLVLVQTVLDIGQVASNVWLSTRELISSMFMM